MDVWSPCTRIGADWFHIHLELQNKAKRDSSNQRNHNVGLHLPLSVSLWSPCNGLLHSIRITYNETQTSQFCIVIKLPLSEFWQSEKANWHVDESDNYQYVFRDNCSIIPLNTYSSWKILWECFFSIDLATLFLVIGDTNYASRCSPTLKQSRTRRKST